MVDSKSKSIPQWQRAGASQTPPSKPLDSNTDTNTEVGNEDRKELLKLASDWLKHEDIRDESTDQKVSFLREKGLTEEETSKLLRLSPATDSSEDRGREEVIRSDVSLEYRVTEALELTDVRHPYRHRPRAQLIECRHHTHLSLSNLPQGLRS